MHELFNIFSDPMRITKKFAGASCIGKQVYQHCASNVDTTAEIFRVAEVELERLERLFLSRLGSKSLLFDDENEVCSEETTIRPSSASTLLNSPINCTGVSSYYTSIVASGDGTNKQTRNAQVSKLKRTVSAPLLGKLITQTCDDLESGRQSALRSYRYNSLSTTSSSIPRSRVHGLFQRGQRSQSMMNLLDFEHYMASDQAAGTQTYQTFLYNCSCQFL